MGVASRIVHAVLAAQLADLPGIERIEVVDTLDVDAQHGPQRDRVAERVEERQDAEQHVVADRAARPAAPPPRSSRRCRGSASPPWARPWSPR